MRGLLALLLALLCLPAWAHVGSKDVFEQVTAGPYTLMVTVRMPNVIPGAAAVEARVVGGTVSDLEVTPMPLTGEASKHPPAADAMVRSNDDPAFFTGGVWMMASGAWQIRFAATGAAGVGTASVPVTAVAVRTLPMQRGLGWTLALLGLFLVVTMAGTVAAAVREARLIPGAAPSAALRRRGLVAMAGSLAAMALALWGGAAWWRVDAASYAGAIFQPLHTEALLTGNRLDLKVTGEGKRHNDDFLPDHGKLIHLYAIRQPEMDAVFHLHPAFDGKGDFRMELPAMPAGAYTLYGDVVHVSGFPETLVTRLDVPAGMVGGPLGADDAKALPPPISEGPLGTSYPLPDGYRMVWDQPSSLTVDTPYVFHFKLLRPDLAAATDLQLYLGMAGHAAFVKTDGTVFAHTHPEGTAPMASLMLANGGMEMPTVSLGNTVDFPYGFPSAGQYRILVQMKHGGRVDTGVFDAAVSAR